MVISTRANAGPLHPPVLDTPDTAYPGNTYPGTANSVLPRRQGKSDQCED